MSIYSISKSGVKTSIPTLTAAATGASYANGEIHITSTYAVTGNLVFNNFVDLTGGMLTGTSANSVTFNSGFRADLSQHFSGGIVVNGLLETSPEWWVENTTPGTTDMRAAVQAANDVLTAGGKIISSGMVYGLGATTLALTRSMPDAKFKKIAASPIAVTITGSGNFDRMQIDGNGLAARGLILLPGSVGLSLKNLQISNVQESGTGTTIATGIEIQGGCSDFTIQDPIVSRVTGNSTGTARGILFTKLTGQIASKNIGLTGFNVSDVTTGTYSASNDADAIVVQDAGKRVSIIIRDGSVNNAQKRAVKIQDPGVKIENVDISANGIVMYAGISVYASSVSVKGVHAFDGWFANGIVEAGTAGITYDDCSIISNTIENTDNETWECDGIKVYGNWTNLKVYGNTIKNTRCAINGSAVISRGNISLNDITNTTSHGIYLPGVSTTGCSNIPFVGNTFANVTRNGISAPNGGVNLVAVGNVGTAGWGVIGTAEIIHEFGNVGGNVHAPGALAKAADYTITAGDMRQGISNTGATGTITLSLPAAVIGMKTGPIIRLANFEVRIAPNGTQIIGSGTAGQYLILSTVMESFTLECFVTGRWEIVAASPAATPTYGG